MRNGWIVLLLVLPLAGQTSSTHVYRDHTFEFVSTEMSLSGKVVKGAPYSAEAVTESAQTLSDGNHINRRSTAKLFRDSEGRTRREQTLERIGPLESSGEPKQLITITDPVAGVSYTLDPATKTARKITQFHVMTRSPEGKDVEVFIQVPVAATGSALHEGIGVGESAAMTTRSGHITTNRTHAANRESLGKRSLEGVEAQGSSSSFTVPAGQIGNERPIEVVSESWYSPELQLIVSTHTNDPRMGETSYRLTNINRSEPARNLFEVPSDYTIQEEHAPARLRMKKEEM